MLEKSAGLLLSRVLLVVVTWEHENIHASMAPLMFAISAQQSKHGPLSRNAGKSIHSEFVFQNPRDLVETDGATNTVFWSGGFSH